MKLPHTPLKFVHWLTLFAALLGAVGMGLNGQWWDMAWPLIAAYWVVMEAVSSGYADRAMRRTDIVMDLTERYAKELDRATADLESAAEQVISLKADLEDAENYINNFKPGDSIG